MPLITILGAGGLLKQMRIFYMKPACEVVKLDYPTLLTSTSSLLGETEGTDDIILESLLGEPDLFSLLK